LLSQISASDETTLSSSQLKAIARAARLNPNTDLPALLSILERRRLVDQSASGVSVLGVTGRAILGHAADIFVELEPTKHEAAAIVFAEESSSAPVSHATAQQQISDLFKLPSRESEDFLTRSETIGFVDSEGKGADKLYFNGNLFRGTDVGKVKRVMDSLSAADHARVADLEALFNQHGCVGVAEADRILGASLFEKLRSVAVYDVNHVSNASGDFAFVTRPSAFHKFVSPMVDDAFDLAKALVAALTYGMTQSAAGRGRIFRIEALLGSLIAGRSVGPATAIGEDYRVLEQKGVIKVIPDGGLYRMKLLKKDVGQIALQVLTTGDAISATVLDTPPPAAMTGYVGPEKSRTDLRRRQTQPSRRMTQDVLQALRTKGSV
jgi:hypothetical protein